MITPEGGSEATVAKATLSNRVSEILADTVIPVAQAGRSWRRCVRRRGRPSVA
jgi:hypothetical protein